MARITGSRLVAFALLAVVGFGWVSRAGAVSPEEIEQKLKTLEEEMRALKQQLEQSKAAPPPPSPPAAQSAPATEAPGLTRDRACSTSATTGQVLRIGSRTFSHIIDPRTGRPVPALAQVTVLAHSAARAEAISTALLVLGRNSLRQISRTLAVDVCWIDRSGVYTTPGFRLRRAGGAKAIQIRS